LNPLNPFVFLGGGLLPFRIRAWLDNDLASACLIKFLTPPNEQIILAE